MYHVSVIMGTAARHSLSMSPLPNGVCVVVIHGSRIHSCRGPWRSCDVEVVCVRVPNYRYSAKPVRLTNEPTINKPRQHATQPRHDCGHKVSHKPPTDDSTCIKSKTRTTREVTDCRMRLTLRNIKYMESLVTHDD